MLTICYYMYVGNYFYALENNMRKGIQINESESLILWKALEMYRNGLYSGHSVVNGINFDKALEESTMLLAKVVHKSCDLGGSLEKGETVKSIYKGLVD